MEHEAADEAADSEADRVRFDEPARWKPAIYQECEVAYPLVEAGVTAGDMAEFWKAQPFDLGIPSERGNCDLCCLKGRGSLLETIRAEPWRSDWWIEAERRRGGRTFRIGESYEALRAAALAGESAGAGDDEALPSSARMDLTTRRAGAWRGRWKRR